MNEGDSKQPHDELAEGHEEKSSEEESAAGAAPGATSAAAGEAGRQEVAGKRPHVHSQRMKEYLAQQDKTVPQKLRQCPYPGCQKVFSSAPGLRYHKRTHSPTAGHFYCDRCKKKFKSLNGLKYHKQKTKCPDTPMDSGPSSPPTPGQPQQHHSLPLTLPYSPAVTAESEDRTQQQQKNDETDSMHDSSYITPSQDWPEPRHRKMESRRKKMEFQQRQAAQRDQLEGGRAVVPSLSTCPPRPLEHGSSEAERLLEFANIATGPQSPLLRRKAIDWDYARDCASKDAALSDGAGRVNAPVPVTPASTVTVTSLQEAGDSTAEVSPSPMPAFCESDSAEGVRTHTLPEAVWQCFFKGSRICLRVEDPSSKWHLVETVAGSHLHGCGPVLPEDLREPVPLRLLAWHKSEGCDEEVDLVFESLSRHGSCLTACCSTHHPFYVRNKGWASFDTSRTKEMYGLHSIPLEKDDICLPPSLIPPVSAAKDSGGSEVKTLEYSSVVALSEMAQKRSQEGSTGQQVTPVSPSGQDAPKAKRPMNAFLLWSQTKRPEFLTKFPKTNNRDISGMLSKEWHKLSESEKRPFQTKARVKAELQKAQHPDCWKRKH